MIPKIIHYCWFGKNPKPELALKCIRSWKKYCPNYEIIEWNEENYDLSAAPLYVKQAYEAKRWAFVTDYVRLQAVYQYGGIYLDTDVELVKKPDDLLRYHAFFCFEEDTYVATGLGFGAQKGSYLLLDLMNDYADIPFVKEDGSLDLSPCPIRNAAVFRRYGLKNDGTYQLLNGEICILPTQYMCPLDNRTGILRKTRKTISIHWYSASWADEECLKSVEEARIRNRAWQRKDRIIHLPNRILRRILGNRRYELLKKILKK